MKIQISLVLLAIAVPAVGQQQPIMWLHTPAATAYDHKDHYSPIVPGGYGPYQQAMQRRAERMEMVGHVSGPHKAYLDRLAADDERILTPPPRTAANTIEASEFNRQNPQISHVSTVRPVQSHSRPVAGSPGVRGPLPVVALPRPAVLAPGIPIWYKVLAFVLLSVPVGLWWRGCVVRRRALGAYLSNANPASHFIPKGRSR